MARRQLSNKDRALTADLVRRNGVAAVVREARACAPRGRGRPIELYPYTSAHVYGYIECWRKQRGGVDSACRHLEAILQQITPDQRLHLSWRTLRRMYYEAQKKRRIDPVMAELMQHSLHAAEAGGSVPILFYIDQDRL